MLQKWLACDKLFSLRVGMPTRDMMEEVYRHVRMRNPCGIMMAWHPGTAHAANSCSVMNFSDMFTHDISQWTRTYHKYQIATMLRDATVLITGGVSKEHAVLLEATRDAFLFELDHSVGVGAMVEARSNHVLLPLYDGGAIAMGGRSSMKDVLHTYEYYHPRYRTWTRGYGSLPRPLQLMAATALFDGTIMLIGGCSVDGSASSECYIFNPSTQKFKKTASMATARIAPACVTTRAGHVLVTGGRNIADVETGYYLIAREVYSSCELYDVESDSWIPFPSMPRPSYGHWGFSTPGTYIFICTKAFQGYQVYDFNTKIWRQAESVNMFENVNFIARFYNKDAVIAKLAEEEEEDKEDGEFEASFALFD